MRGGVTASPFYPNQKTTDMKMRVKKGLVPQKVATKGSVYLIEQPMCDMGGEIINVEPYTDSGNYHFKGEKWLWRSEWLEPVEDETPSFESEIARLIEAYPDKADELKKLMPDVKPLVPRGWQILHPNGNLFMTWPQPKLAKDHILLNDIRFTYSFEDVDNCSYLKVTPK